MAKNQENFGDLSKLASITDQLQKIFPEGKSLIIVELNIFDFENIKKITGNQNERKNHYKIDISDVEIVFIQEGTYDNDKVQKSTPKPKKKSLINKFLNKVFSKKSS